MRRALVLLLLLPAFVPCGLPADGCDEASTRDCSQPCHLGCALAAAPLPAVISTPVAPAPDGFRRDLEAQPISRPHLPELPPPRA